jgi:hypothetical protein
VNRGGKTLHLTLLFLANLPNYLCAAFAEVFANLINLRRFQYIGNTFFLTLDIVFCGMRYSILIVSLKIQNLFLHVVGIHV